MGRLRPAWLLALSAAWLLGEAAPAHAQQDLGHKLLGGLGIKAGFQLDPGVYVADRLAWYGLTRLVDREGNTVPLEGLELDALANGVGVTAVARLGADGPYLGSAIGAPLARVSLNIDRPDVTLDSSGLADAYVQPIKLGWRGPYFDVVTSYALYVPTHRFTPGEGSGVSRAQFTHELTLGGAVFFDEERAVYLSALASYELNMPKIGVDITRGDTIQVQGGFGVTLWRIVDVGLAGYALWQVRDDRGNDVPPVLRGGRDRAFGVGPDLQVAIPQLHLAVGVRYERDFGVRSRPQGEILVFTLAWAAWSPR